MAAITSNHIQGRRSKRDTSKTVVWEFWDGRGEPGDSGGRWAKIFKKAQRDLEAAYNSAPGAPEITLSAVNPRTKMETVYRYDLTTMTQQNTTTNYIRAIRRKLIAEAAPDGATDDQPHRPKPGRTSAAPPDVGDDVTCSICCAAQVLAADQEELLSSGCRSQHGTRSVCDECVQQHIREEVMGKANSTRILCPQAGCKSVLEHQDIQRWAIASVFETYDTLLLRQTLQALPDFRWCSHAGCGSGQLHEGGDAAQIVRCEQCRRRTCFTHRCVWHEGRTCEQYDADARASEEVALLQALEGGAVKRCPSCRIGIEKNEGCDHMTCKREVGGCGHEFCWRCDAPYAGAAGIRAVGNRAHARTCQYHM